MITASKGALHRLAIDVLTASHGTQTDAEAVARSLTWADLHGRHSEGIERLPALSNMLSKGLIKSPADMIWSGHAPAIYHLDGGFGFGQVAGEMAIRKAIAIAKTMGVGMVTVNRSNDYGAAAYYASIAAEAGCIGITTTNTLIRLPHRNGNGNGRVGKPIAVGAPTSSNAPLLVDVATAHHIVSNDAMTGERSEGPGTMGPIDQPGASRELLNGANADRQYGLNMMVEVMSSILSGAEMSFEVEPPLSGQGTENCGHMFMAIDISHTQPLSRYFRRTDALIASQAPLDVHGEFPNSYPCEAIPVDEQTAAIIEHLARELSVTIPWKNQ